MNKPIQLLSYDDSPVFGGHQVMAALALEGLASDARFAVVAAISPFNTKNRARLEKIRGLRIVETPVTSQKMQGLRTRFARSELKKTVEWLRNQFADALVVMQGDIEGSSLALRAGRQLSLPTISYIAVPHELDMMGAKLGRLRDRLHQSLFQLPLAWLTLSESMEEILRRRGARQPIRLVPNGVHSPALRSEVSSPEARRALKIPEEGWCVAAVGRVEFKQKQQDFLVRAFDSLCQSQPDSRLMIVGSGPDEFRLHELISRSANRERIHLISWTDQTDLIYRAIDALAIPSRFEGVPLVMLEALAAGVPVVGTGRDGMKDLLPAEWTFRDQDIAGFLKATEEVRLHSQKKLASLQKRVQEEHSPDQFKKKFGDHLWSLLHL